ncbi:MAG TPA: 3D domain-containing protein [Longimicrobium sp.]|nr:3D domain-containing protein [Longimicrobium sp.]
MRWTDVRDAPRPRLPGAGLPRVMALAAVLAALAPHTGMAQGTPAVPPAPTSPTTGDSASSPKVLETPPPQRAVQAVEVEAVPPAREGGRSAAAFPVSRTLEMRSTAYCLRGTMRTGVRVRDGMAAADPSVLPLGSVVRLTHPDGRLIGIFVIMDTGGAVRGNKIDIWLASCREATDWGTRRVVAEVLAIGKV